MLSLRDHSRPILKAVLLCAALAGSNRAALAADPLSNIPNAPDAEVGGQVSKESALAEAYLTGKGVSRDPKQAAYWFEKAAGLGDPVAQNQIGYLYQVGLGVPADPVRAVRWFRLAASNGLTNAKVNLAVAYIWGVGTQTDPGMGEKLLLEAAAKGNSIAATYLGDLYYNGQVRPKDEAAGEKWYEKAVKMHSYLAEYRMGMLLSEPVNHAQDYKRAVSLFRQSAAAGYVPAMHSLGRLLVNHPELCTSHQEALTLLNDAADAGTWQSSVVLGALARDGKWITQDPRQAYFHFRAGAIQGGDRAKALVAKDLQILSAKLSAEELAQLNEQAADWAREHGQLISMLYRGQKAGPAAGTLALATPIPGAHAGTLVPLTIF
jgi:TPR repeat protein